MPPADGDHGSAKTATGYHQPLDVRLSTDSQSTGKDETLIGFNGDYRTPLPVRCPWLTKQRYANLWAIGTLEPDRWVTSNLVQPTTLLAVRIVMLLFCLVTTALLLVYEKTEFFYYFTDLSFFGLTVYLLAAILLSVQHCWNIATPCLSVPLRWYFGLVFWAMYECVATFHVFVPLMYWIVLSRGFRSETPLISYCGIAPHSLNLVVVIIEEVLNRHHLHPSHAIVPLAVLLLYLAWSYVLYAIRHEYVYPFLDINVYHGFVALFLVAIALATVIVFFVQLYLHNRRDQWLRHRRQQLVSNRQMTDAALMSQT